MGTIRAWAALAAGQRLEAYEYDPGPLGEEEVEIAVEHCGLCYSDWSMIANDWRFSRYPLVPGHEIVGRVVALGARVMGLSPGQRVGVGWNSGSCMHCAPCLSGSPHQCASAQATISGHHGGFAERVRAHWAFAVPLPEELRAATAGPLFCGGITVFTPFVEYGISPTGRVGVVGIGGLGHLALRFAHAWGCEVTAFTSDLSKRGDLLAMGAHRVVGSRDAQAIAAIAGRLDMVLVTVNVALDWDALIATLGPKGRLHIVGALPEPVPVKAFALMGNQRSVSGSAVGSPLRMATMLEFCARHGIEPQVERFPMSRANEAIERLRAGKARYRIVLDNDFD